MLPAILGRKAVPALPRYIPAPASGQLPARPVRVRREGFLVAFFRPIGIAIALVIVGAAGISIWNIQSASDARRALHEAPALASQTSLATSITRQVAPEETEFVLRLIDGRLVRVIADEGEVSAFLAGALGYLQAARARADQRAVVDMDQLFAAVFATRDQDLEDYADWFFAWGRSWRFLYEATTGAAQEMGRLFFSQTQVSDAARHAVEDYLLRHYQELVLKPSLRDQHIADGLRRIVGNAHQDYLMAVAGLDDRMQRFLAEKTHHVEELDAGAITVDIDWDAERWRAPRYAAEDRYLEPVVSVALVAGGAALGGIVQRAIVPVVSRTAAQVLVSSQFAVGGAAAGSVSPGIGTAIGALVGAGVDWGLSAFREYTERDDFIRDNATALDATIAAWKAKLSPEVATAIDVWFDDTEVLLTRMDLVE